MSDKPRKANPMLTVSQAKAAEAIAGVLALGSGIAWLWGHPGAFLVAVGAVLVLDASLPAITNRRPDK